LDDNDEAVRTAGAKSIALIGNAAIPFLERTFHDERDSVNHRAMSLWTLGNMRAENSLILARASLADPSENPIVRKDAATVIGFLKDSSSTDLLLKVLKHSQDNDIILTKNIVWSLGEIAAPSTVESLVLLLSSPDESLRLKSVWALSHFKGEDVSAKLAVVIEKDASEKVKEAAKESLEWQKRIQ
jgi:HEAT repeat protein